MNGAVLGHRGQWRWGRVRAAAMLAAALGLLSLGGAPAARATPRHAARYGQNCHLCHHNPTGGGLRTLYASQYIAPVELAARAVPPAEAPRLDPQLGPDVVVGADLRTLHLAAPERSGEHGFFQMQADVYLAFQLDDRTSAYVDRGQSGTEAFGLAHVLPLQGYVKLGRFVPPIGWQFEDHTAFVRQELGQAPPRHTDTGLEVGLYPGRLALHAALLNGAPGVARDDDRAFAAAGRALYRTRWGSAQLALGGGYWRQREETGARAVGGPLGAVAWGPLVWMGEIDWLRRPHPGGGATTALVVWHEAAWRLARGLDLRATYGFHDPDLARRTGAQARYGLGADLLLTGNVGLHGMLNLWRREDGPDLGGRDDLQSVLMAHLFY